VVVFAAAVLTVSNTIVLRAAVVVVALAAAGIYGTLAVQVKETGRYVAEYLSAVDKVRRNSVMLPMESDPFNVGTISPLAHAYDYYAIFRGGANGKGIAQFNTVAPIVYRSYPTTDRFPIPGRGNDLRAVSRAYDYVLLWGGGSSPALLLRKVGFDLVHEQGDLRLFENRQRQPEREAMRDE
jgi:hypothetical protein